MKPYIYLRALKHADYTVFCVQDGQKTYWDPLFNCIVPFSSGQQVKRSVLTSLMDDLQLVPSPTTFVLNNSFDDKEPLSACDPSYVDQLLGGWMKASAGGKEKTLKRRSPLSISAMRALHPLLAGINSENISFDRSDHPDSNRVCLRDANGKDLSVEDVEAVMADFEQKSNRSLFRRWIPDNRRATGLFVYDIAIDLRTLFAVSTNSFEPEISKEMAEKLAANGWVKSRNVFGECLVAPKAKRNQIIPALAKALLNWRITSNQARTFSLMETLAVAISDNANTLSAAIRAKLTDDGERKKAVPVVDETVGADLYVTLPCAGYIVTENESAEAMEMAEAKLVELMSAFDYEHQME